MWYIIVSSIWMLLGIITVIVYIEYTDANYAFYTIIPMLFIDVWNMTRNKLNLNLVGTIIGNIFIHLFALIWELLIFTFAYIIYCPILLFCKMFLKLFQRKDKKKNAN